jgi:ATP-dependent Clp protease ATP-binding subunit ClpC
MEERIRKSLVGQQRAVEAVSKAVRRARVGFKNPNRPIASFMFAGPTGVGKTELTKVLSSQFSGDRTIRFDMSEYMERQSVSRLIGSAPGYVGYSEGGQLTEAVRKQPYSVVLFDELEKAHPDIFNIMLQILEDGRLTDSRGQTVDFKNTIIILTSNIGADIIEKSENQFGFDDQQNNGESYKRLSRLVVSKIKANFRPEFLNRLDEIIVFEKLTKTNIGAIAKIMLADFRSRASLKGIVLKITKRFSEKLNHDGYDPAYGARPLRRAVTNLMEDTLSEGLLRGKIKEGDKVILH